MKFPFKQYKSQQQNPNRGAWIGLMLCEELFWHFWAKFGFLKPESNIGKNQKAFKRNQKPNYAFD